ncbi:hypothetical protein JY651_27120 [Pyxidicoccus parkwayensis]|uniref:YokE-like PH domain-containing protein n=1 Tax=Pyxidicoccus parkwayensis TaxID=2813578 RepID=A0ABX7NJH9_9BACT|nr:hypothetical protein [Pyxidicoccus parkwaysis]QSQ19020.1 hypothetical protein JY651_27120 [Pyxidicoccus parkwaysis]
MGLMDVFKNAFSNEAENVSTPYVMQVAGSMLTVTVHDDFLLVESTGLSKNPPESIPISNVAMVKKQAVALGISSLSIIVKSGKGLDYKFANKVAANGQALIERLMKK